jgi:hypothetical protein
MMHSKDGHKHHGGRIGAPCNDGERQHGAKQSPNVQQRSELQKEEEEALQN